jgi:phospholipid/cholesterol/gamma-HCH transport system ATP-binding protein
MNDAQDTPMIRMQDLQKGFGRKQVLRGIDLELGKGESVVIIGGSGTGKSVMLKCVLGLLEADKGSIEVEGMQVVGASSRERDVINSKIGMLFQNAALFDSLSVWENVAFGLVQGEGMARKEAKEIAMEKLAQVGLGPDVGALQPAELSGGMKKRVGLARAIATDPDIIFFDEPTTGLDPIMSDVINDLIAETVSQMGASALSITHDMASARKIGHRIAMLYEGRIIWDGAVSDIDHSGNEYVDQFINGRADGPIQMQVRAP